MPVQRVPLAHNIGSRDGTLNKDAKLGNAVIEVEKGETISLVKRPGLSTYQTSTAGAGLGIYSIGTHLFTIVGTTFYDNGVSKGTVNGTDTYDFIQTLDQTQVFFKNKAKGYVYTLATGAILDLTGTITTQGATVTGGSPTVTLSASNAAIQVGQNISGSGISAGTYVLTVYGTTLTLSSNAIATGATTLTFTTSYPSSTVTGAAFIDGYYLVATSAGLIFNSNVEDPTTWQAINYIGAVSQSDKLMAIARDVNYILAMGTETVEFFYDAGTSPGSPFLPYQNNVLQFGCAEGHTVVEMDNTVAWMSTSKQRGYQVMVLANMLPQVISNQYIERILALCSPSSAYAFSVKTSGHSLYVLTLTDLNITLVYDFAQHGWTYWSSVENNLEKYFSCYKYNNFNGIDVLLHESNGKTYKLDPTVYQDDGNPINVLARTTLIDFKTNARKFYKEMQIVGDKVDSYALLRWTNDDYVNYSEWQNVNLNTPKSQVHRGGQARRRSFDLLHSDNTSLRLSYIEIDVDEGDS